MSNQPESQPTDDTPARDPVEPIESTPVAAEPRAPDPLDDLPLADAAITSAHPRSIKRRIEQQRAAELPPLSDARPSRVRSQPLSSSAAPKRPREPVLLDWEPEPQTGPWRAKPLVVGLAVVGWIAALALLVADPARIAGLTPRLLLPGMWALAAALTFVPVQVRLGLPGVGWQGVLGFGLLGYLLAFVPAPSGWLLDLPDLPVYLLLFFAVFYAVAAGVAPLTYLIGQRFYKLRIHRLDVGRARRQAYEIGLLIVVTLGMAGLRVLTPMTFGLLALVVVLTEALLLSQVQPEG
jgi:hypothetical protein